MCNGFENDVKMYDTQADLTIVLKDIEVMRQVDTNYNMQRTKKFVPL